jgi:hypothetical protein
VLDDNQSCHHPRNQFRDVFQLSFIPQVTEMAGPPEERQKQLIYERERAREAVCMILVERTEER